MAIAGASGSDPEAQQIELLKGLNGLASSQKDVVANITNLKNTIVNVVQHTDSSINQLKDSMNRQSEALLNYFKGQSAKKLLDASTPQSDAIEKLTGKTSSKSSEITSAAISEAIEVSKVTEKLDTLVEFAKENNNSDLVNRMLTVLQKDDLFESTINKLADEISDKKDLFKNEKLINAISKNNKSDKTLVSSLLSQLSKKTDYQPATPEEQDLASRTLEVLSNLESHFSSDKKKAKTTSELLKMGKGGNGMFSGLFGRGERVLAPIGRSLVAVAKNLPVFLGLAIVTRDLVIVTRRIGKLLGDWQSENQKRDARNKDNVTKSDKKYRKQRAGGDQQKLADLADAQDILMSSRAFPEKARERIMHANYANKDEVFLNAARELAIKRISASITALETKAGLKAGVMQNMNEAYSAYWTWGNHVIAAATVDLNKCKAVGEIQQVMTEWIKKVLVEGTLILKRFSAMYNVSDAFDDQIKEAMKVSEAMTILDPATKNYISKLEEDLISIKDIEVPISGWFGTKTRKLSELKKGDTTLVYPYQDGENFSTSPESMIKNFLSTKTTSEPNLQEFISEAGRGQITSAIDNFLGIGLKKRNLPTPKITKWSDYQKLDVNTPEGYYEAIPQKLQIPYGYYDVNKDGVVDDSEFFPNLAREVDGDLLQFSDQIKKLTGLDQGRYIKTLEEYAKVQIESNNLSREQLQMFQKILDELVKSNQERINEYNSVQPPTYNMNVNNFGTSNIPAQPKR